MAEKAKKDSFLKTSLAELILLFHMMIGGDGKTSSGKEGTWARFVKTKLHFLTREDEVKEGAFIRDNLSDKELKKYDRLKKIINRHGYDVSFFRVHFSNLIKENSSASKKIILELLSSRDWRAKKISLDRYHLLKKKSVLLLIWENRWFILFCVVFFVVVNIIILNNL